MDATAAQLHPDLLERVKGLAMRATTLAVGARTGAHRSKLLGGGSEFSEYKSYEPGDDLRHLDWRVQARTDRNVIRRYQSDRVRTLEVLLDRTGSMAFGTTGDHAPGVWGPWPGTKWEAASTLALAIGFIALRQGDRVGLWTVEKGTGDRALLGLGGPKGAGRVPPRGGVNHLRQMALQVGSAGPRGEGSLAAAATQVAAVAKRSELVVVSDLLSDGVDAWIEPLAVHRARGREVQVLHVIDPAEIQFPYEEPTLFEDLEDGETLSVNARELARTYRAEYAAFLERCRTACARAGVRYLQIRTDVALEESLVPFLRGEEVQRGV